LLLPLPLSVLHLNHQAHAIVVSTSTIGIGSITASTTATDRQ
jgi:hypothetical protein